MAGIRRVTVASQQRTDAVDMNRTNEFALGNLAAVLARALTLSPGDVYRGGKVKPTGPASKNVIVEPLFGLSSGGDLLLLEAEATLAVPNNTSGNPRIDLVSVGLTVADDPAELRWFWDTGSQSKFQQNTVTKRNHNAVPVLTVGTPAGSPVAPATPVGHIPLAHVLVVDGFASIVADDITRVDASKKPLAAVVWAGAGDLESLPHTVTDQVLSVPTPADAITLLYGQAHVASTNSFNAAAVHRPLVVEIEEVGVGRVAAAAYHMEVGAQRTVHVAGVVVGPKAAPSYRLKFSDLAAGSGTAWGGFTLPELIDVDPTTNLLVAVTL